MVICPTGRIRASIGVGQKIFVEQSVRANPIFSIDSTNLPDGQITQKSV
jgi:hypothetical protein